MRVFISIPIFLLFTLCLPAQTLQRFQEESLLDFVSRVGPDSADVMPEITREMEWDGTPVILAFYQREVEKTFQTLQGYVDHSKYQIIVGYVFHPVSEFNYKVAMIDTFMPEGGDPEILSVF